MLKRPANMQVRPIGFTNFLISPISPWIFRQFHQVQNVEDCSLQVGKETTAFEPVSWEWKVSCHV